MPRKNTPRELRRRKKVTKVTLTDGNERPIRGPDGKIETTFETTDRRPNISGKMLRKHGRDPRVVRRTGKVSPGTKVRVRSGEPFEKVLRRFKKSVQKGR